jgi:ribosomal protein S18 acetylase RimI-like enzyme
MTFQIRVARPDEYEALGEIVVVAYRDLGALHGDEAYASELRDVATRAREAVVLAAVEAGDRAGRLLGCATYVPGAASPWGEELRPGEASIRMLAVHPASQGLGAGKALAAACVERARGDGFRAVMLHSLPTMVGAQRIYARLGFRHVAERDWEPVSGILLRCFVLDL